MPGGHPGEAGAVGAELPPRELERVAEAMPHERLPRNPDPIARSREPPAQVDVLTGGVRGVERALEERIAAEDRGRQPEPVAASTGVVVGGQGAAPVARPGSAAEGGLERVVATRLELGEQSLEGALRQDHVGVDQGHERRGGRADSDHPRRGHSPALVGEDSDVETAGQLEGSVRREAVDDDDL